MNTENIWKLTLKCDVSEDSISDSSKNRQEIFEQIKSGNYSPDWMKWNNKFLKEATIPDNNKLINRDNNRTKTTLKITDDELSRKNKDTMVWRSNLPTRHCKHVARFFSSAATDEQGSQRPGKLLEFFRKNVEICKETMLLYFHISERS